MAPRTSDRVAEEQAALRRVATLVARATPPEAVFTAVAAEVGRLLDVDYTVLFRYDPPDAVAILAAWTRNGTAAPTPVGSRLQLGGRNVTSRVVRTGRPARLDAYADVSGTIANVATWDWGSRSSVGVPISVEDRLWGVIIVAYTRDEPLPAATEARLVGFTELVSTAIANAQAQVELRGFAEEQAALRRVATLVARASPAEEVFAAVAAEVGRALDADVTILSRYDADGAATVVATWNSKGRDVLTPIGSRFDLEGRNVHTLVFRTGRPARTAHADAAGPAADVFRPVGIRLAVGVPVSVAGRLWGVMIVLSTREEPLPPDTEDRLAGFTELVATAIANAQARVELRGFAEEQAAKRRVATLVARAAPQEQVFAAVTAEVGPALHADLTVLARYDRDGAARALAAWSSAGDSPHVPDGAWVSFWGESMATLVFESGGAARVEDYGVASGVAADAARRYGLRSAVGVPISVEGRLWGVVAVASASAEPLPVDTEARLAGFTELVATALANAEAQAALIESRARIVAAADTTRARIERDLHDGAQQRLVSLALRLRSRVQGGPRPEAGELVAEMDAVAEGLTGVLDELREIARGLHPAALAEGGLRPALKTLARRSAVPVRLEVGVEGRLPEPVELAVYYVVAEALTNAAKHAGAGVVDVHVVADAVMFRVRVRDDGRGGADLSGGTGLVGLTDRVEALGGRFRLHSPPGAGTTLEISVPLGSGLMAPD